VFRLRRAQTDSKFCHRLATVIDKQTRVSNDVTVCSGGGRGGRDQQRSVTVCSGGGRGGRGQQRSVSHVTGDSATVEVRLYSPSTTLSHAASAPAAGESFGTASLRHSLLKYEGRSRLWRLHYFA